MNISDAVADPDLGAGTFQYKRPTATLANEGEISRTWSTPADFVGNIQPIGEERVARYLAEGDRYDAYIVCFTASALIEDDLIVFGGNDHKVFHVGDWGPHGFRRVLAGRSS